MDKHIEKIYLDEIRRQADSAIECHNQMNTFLQNGGTNDDFYREAEHFLQHAAAISLLLWPTQGNKTRGQHLRKSLNIQDENILHKRVLRDHIVHFDERLDNWVEASKSHNVIDRNIGDPDKLVSGVDPNDRIRHYNSENSEYSFLNEPFNIQEIFTAITNLRQSLSNLGS